MLSWSTELCLLRLVLQVRPPLANRYMGGGQTRSLCLAVNAWWPVHLLNPARLTQKRLHVDILLAHHLQDERWESGSQCHFGGWYEWEELMDYTLPINTAFGTIQSYLEGD